MNIIIKKLLGVWYKLIQNYIFKIIGVISPKTLVSIQYKRGFKHALNWQDPKDINEKINWLKFNSNTEIWTKLTDKYLVREHIAKMGFADMLVKLYGKWEKPEDQQW